MYKALHLLLTAAFRVCVILPLSVAFLACYYAAFPLAVLVGLATFDTAGDFRGNLYESFVEMPARFFRELFTF